MATLITGGAGFIGSHFTELMLEKYPKIEIVVLDKLTYAGNLRNLGKVKDKIDFIHGDICSKQVLRGVFKQHNIRACYNFASATHVDTSITNPEPFVQTDIVGAFNILEEARRHDTHMIQISSDEVYGSTEEGSFTEDSPPNPSSPYSASKASADMLVNAYHKTYGLKTTTTRSTNNYGPRQYPEKLIPVLIQKALNNRELPLYADGRNVRDWLHVKDNCEAIELAARKGESGEAYNIAGGEEYENLVVAKAILTYLGRPHSLIRFVEDRPGHDFRYSVDDKKIREIGWKPKVDFAAGLRHTIEWYRKNTGWWRNG